MFAGNVLEAVYSCFGLGRVPSVPRVLRCQETSTPYDDGSRHMQHIPLILRWNIGVEGPEVIHLSG